MGRPGVDEPMLGEIARLMAIRMSYLDPIWIAQLKLQEFETDRADSTADVKRFRLDELIGALPAAVAEPVLDALEWAGWTHKSVSIRFSAKSRWGVRRLKIEAGLRRGPQLSAPYAARGALVGRPPPTIR